MDRATRNALKGRGAVPTGPSDQPPGGGGGGGGSVLSRQRHLASMVMGPAGRPASVSTSTASGGTDSRQGSCAPQGYQHFPRYGGLPSRSDDWPYPERDSAHDRGIRSWRNGALPAVCRRRLKTDPLSPVEN